jgi:hypothetical protein
MLRTVPVLLIALVCLLTLTTCETLTSIIATEPARPTEESAVRLLCTRASDGTLILGPVQLSRKDTEETRKQVEARNDAWDAATNEGKLCGLGAEDFGKLKWGDK